MLQGRSRKKKPCAKVINIMQKALWHQEVVFYTVTLGNLFIFRSNQTLPLNAGLCRDGSNISQATCGSCAEPEKWYIIPRIARILPWPDSSEG